MNSFLFLWRRTDRVPVTSTDLIFFPTISLSRSRRKTSTSGSSGIAIPLLRLFLQSRPCDPGRRLLRFLFRTSFTFAVRLVTDEHRGGEVLRVVGAFVAYRVPGASQHARGRDFLQARLIVAPARSVGRVGDALAQAAQHNVAGNREPLVE